MIVHTALYDCHIMALLTLLFYCVSVTADDEHCERHEISFLHLFALLCQHLFSADYNDFDDDFYSEDYDESKLFHEQRKVQHVALPLQKVLELISLVGKIFIAVSSTVSSAVREVFHETNFF